MFWNHLTHVQKKKMSWLWTRREHFALDLKVREARTAVDAFTEDHVALTEHMHAARAAREDAERDLAAAKAQKEAVAHDWQRKLQDRRKEVLSLSCCLCRYRSDVYAIGLDHHLHIYQPHHSE